MVESGGQYALQLPFAVGSLLALAANAVFAVDSSHPFLPFILPSLLQLDFVSVCFYLLKFLMLMNRC